MSGLKKGTYFLLLAASIASTVFILHGENIDTKHKPILEGLTIASILLIAIGLFFAFKPNNFKNNLLFEIVNILVFFVFAGLLFIFLRDDKIPKDKKNNIGYLVSICIALLLSTLVLLDDLLDLVPGTKAKVKASS